MRAQTNDDFACAAPWSALLGPYRWSEHGVVWLKLCMHHVGMLLLLIGRKLMNQVAAALAGLASGSRATATRLPSCMPDGAMSPGLCRR